MNRTAKETRYTEVTAREDVTQEILDLAEYAASFQDDRIDWEDVWDRMDGAMLSDGTRLDLGRSSDSSAMRAIRRHINAARRD